MDPITAATLIGVILQVYGTAGAIGGALQSSRIQKQSQQIANALNKNAQFRSKIVEAYQNKDMKLANALIMSSPVGSAYKHLQEEIIKAKKYYDDKIDEIDRSDRKLNEASELIQPASNDIVGVIANKANDPQSVIDKAITDSNSLVEGGIKQ